MSATEFLRLLSWRDLLDVLLVAMVVYSLLLRIRGTRAMQILLGIAFVAVGYWAARAAGLVALETLLEKFLLVLPFAILVLFQQEIRRALANFGTNPFGHGAHSRRLENTLQELTQAVGALAERRVGALIVIERLEGLRDYVEGGVPLDAAISAPLVESLFSTTTPLHDGAIVLRGDRIAAAACLLPLSSSPSIRPELGTRHRAALGIAEETDAIAIVVSEETGELALAHDAKLDLHLDLAGLRQRLRPLLANGGNAETAGAA